LCLSGTFHYSSQYNSGLLFRLSESFFLISEFKCDFSEQHTFRAGMEYVIMDKLVIRSGVSGKPYLISAGMGFQFKKLSIDVADSFHQYLGNSPSVSFKCQF